MCDIFSYYYHIRTEKPLPKINKTVKKINEEIKSKENTSLSSTFKNSEKSVIHNEKDSTNINIHTTNEFPETDGSTEIKENNVSRNPTKNENMINKSNERCIIKSTSSSTTIKENGIYTFY